ncbi:MULTISPECIES: SDR family NAD(P)-dependent oxidoreductase [Herbaspirillum]|jgi:NAD(P)-dependent dehydrogenase (short-subunit alcohol dehydrogenase family)|uniref:Type II 3-hydroxyacyl-CoA dehydrogenase n=1 Tax=Herbaspirillum frisingense GSF30 TaxID=864073 RepID=A0AAI9N3N3_9BURK|nr:MULTISPECIES: SDR family NAD(P)-dependent oxidoreductase [Herbaspirillum]EOA04329.1 type II 3-hydroxyacyl-CoA dehydrogenase [Herbaspirillum frisingense GSF30]MCI1012930.1 SDR family NAD(P)-dependent oxidoreductase [Herbaspirillum sp. C7C2]
MRIEGNVFIVTGAASGLGAATARMIAAAGGKPVLADLNQETGSALAQELGGIFVRCDVSSEDDAQAVVQAAQALGSLRGLINCAGIAPAEKLIGKNGPHTMALFMKTLNINLVGSFNMARFAADAMAKGEALAEGERGIIIHTASVAAYDGQIGQTAYSASKGAIVAMTLPMARDLSRSGIRVMTIAPGIFETPMMLAMPQEVLDSLGQAVPFPPRLGRATEYAQLARSIIENVMLNGETIRLDGAIRMPPK